MGVINWVAFGGILVDLVIISILISNAYWGYRRGLVAVLFKVLVFVVSLLIVFLLYKPVSNSIIENTQLDEWLSNAIRSNLEGTTLNDGNLLEPTESNFSVAVVEMINSFVTEALELAEVDPVGYVSVQLAYFMIRVGTMLLLFMISRFFLLFIRFAAELIGNLPFIKLFNKSGGLVYGIVKGFLTIYLILAVFSIISPLISSWGVISAIEDSTLGKKMYNDNFIVNLVIK
ncbi:MAG: CvpA family protein [Clostridia bacterium]|nr:CvpA family protein [Clostridia bacterium]